MKLHERVMLVQAAQMDLNMAVTSIAERHELTYLELLAMLNQTTARWLRAALQEERYPDEQGDRE